MVVDSRRISVPLAELPTAPESQALRATARGLILVAAPLAFVLVGLPYLAAGFTRAVEVCLGALCGLLLLLGMVYSRRVTGMWLLVSSMCASVVWQMAYPAGTSEYSSIDVIIVFAGISAVMISSRWLGLLAAVIGAFATWSIWTFGPADVLSRAAALGEGAESQLQVACALLLAWWAWNVLRSDAVTHDAEFALVVAGTQRAQDARARARARQEATTVIHESLLNTIRYVLHTPSLNVELLRAEVERTEHLVPVQGELPALSLTSFRQVVTEDAPQRSLVHVAIPEPDVTLQREVFNALRGAVSEAVRNAALHGGASLVDVEIELRAADELGIEISDNGSGVEAGAVEGFGLRHAIVSAVEAIGGTVAISREHGELRISITAPVSSVDDFTAPNLDPFDKARFIVTSALAGLALGGLFFVWNLVTTFDPPEWLDAVVAAAGYLMCTLVVLRRKALDPLPGAVVSLVVAAAPWALLTDSLSCGESAAIIGLVGASGAAITTLALWTRRAAAVPAVVMWLVGAALLLMRVPNECRALTVESSAYIVSAAPILLLAGFFIMRVYVRAQSANARALEERRLEQSRADAAELIDAEYGELVREAQDVLVEVVDLGELDDQHREQLTQVEARIRAVIQVDPDTAGGMAQLARDVVHRFANRGLRVKTKAFVDSHDARPVSESDRAVLHELATGIHGGELEVQLITDGTRDLLTLKFSGISVDVPDQVVQRGDFTVHVSHQAMLDSAVEFVIVAVRQVAPGDVHVNT